MDSISAYIIDTNVFLTEAECIYKFGKNNIIIPLKVLDEIDKHKKRQDLVGAQARKIIRFLDSLREVGNLSEGVKISETSGQLIVKGYDPFALPDDLDTEDSDNQIIATALSVMKASKDTQVILVTRDINMRVKCDSLGISTSDYNLERVVDDLDGLYTGVREVSTTSEKIDDIYHHGSVSVDPSEAWHPNECVVFYNEINPKHSVMTIYDSLNSVCNASNSYGKESIWGVKPRNREQTLAMNLLMDRHYHLA